MENYLEIVSIDAPTEAAEGETVVVTARVKNKHTNWLRMWAVNIYNGQEDWYDTQPWVSAGDTFDFDFSFTMPSDNVSGVIGIYYLGADGMYHLDDQDTYDILLAGVPPEEGIFGEIVGLKVYDESHAPALPPQPTEVGKKLSIQFDAHNNGSGLMWYWAQVTLHKPSGDETKTDRSETGPYAFCKDDHFPFKNDWVADEPGDYYATIILKASTIFGYNYQEVDRITRRKVFAVSPTIYSGRIDHVRARSGAAFWSDALPLNVDVGGDFNVAFRGWNDSSIPLILKGVITVTDAGGNVQGPGAYDSEGELVQVGKQWDFVFNAVGSPDYFSVNISGNYTARMRLFGKKQGESEGDYRELCDPIEKVVVIGIEEPPDGEPGPGEPSEPVPEEPSNKAAIIYKALDYKLLGAGEPIPVVADVPVPEHARISIIAKTTGTEKERLSAKLWIYGPSTIEGEHGPQKYYYGDLSSWPCCDPQAQHEFIFPSPFSTFVIDEVGQWTTIIQIFDATDWELLAEYDGVLCGAVEAPPSMWTIIMQMMPLMMLMMMFSMMIPMTRELGAGTE